VKKLEKEKEEAGQQVRALFLRSGLFGGGAVPPETDPGCF
jgi:hypothetical protein